MPCSDVRLGMSGPSLLVLGARVRRGRQGVIIGRSRPSTMLREIYKAGSQDTEERIPLAHLNIREGRGVTGESCLGRNVR